MIIDGINITIESRRPGDRSMRAEDGVRLFLGYKQTIPAIQGALSKSWVAESRTIRALLDAAWLLGWVPIRSEWLYGAALRWHPDGARPRRREGSC